MVFLDDKQFMDTVIRSYMFTNKHRVWSAATHRYIWDSTKNEAIYKDMFNYASQTGGRSSSAGCLVEYTEDRPEPDVSGDNRRE